MKSALTFEKRPLVAELKIKNVKIVVLRFSFTAPPPEDAFQV